MVRTWGDAGDNCVVTQYMFRLPHPYGTKTGKLTYDADGNGKIAAIHFATIGKNLALTNLDFVII